jgi:hypothetical protein
MIWGLVKLWELVFEVYLKGSIDRGHFNGDEFCQMAGADNFMYQNKRISRRLTLNRTWADIIS